MQLACLYRSASVWLESGGVLLLVTHHPLFFPQVRVPKEETALVSDLRYGWKKLRKLTTDVSDNLARLQVRLARG